MNLIALTKLPSRRVLETYASTSSVRRLSCHILSVYSRPSILLLTSKEEGKRNVKKEELSIRYLLYARHTRYIHV